jgi:hypothetical protein
MKLSRSIAALFAVTLAVAALPAFAATSVLTPYGVRYAVDQTPERAQVEIARSQGDSRAQLVVPTTQDPAEETQAQLAYDAATDTLYVAWARENTSGAEIRFASLDSDGQWSTPRMVAAGSERYRGLHLVVTHSPDGKNGVATLVHLAWWSIEGRDHDPEYALFAYEAGHPISAVAANLEVLAGLANGIETSDFTYTPDLSSPPIAMARNGETVDIAFGAVDSTNLTLLNLEVRKVAGDVRIWKPVGKTTNRTPSAGTLFQQTSAVHGVIVKGRLALYAMGEQFRFVVLRKDGKWSDVHVLRLDDENTAADLVRDLHYTVEELLEHEADSSASAELSAARE